MKLHAKKSLLSICVMTAIGMGVSTSNVMANTLTEAISGGTVSADFRLRMETVTQDNTRKDANSFTLRSRLGYSTAGYKGLSAYLEFENISAISDNYAVPGIGSQEYSVVTDPEGTEVNQIYLKYGFGESTITAGRQRIILDNARFVGNVGWRQNEQTFDAITVSSKAIANTAFTYAFVNTVNTILATETDVAAHLFNMSFTGLANNKFTGYAYLIEDQDKPDDSNSTVGLRYAGKYGKTFKLNAELAKQSSYKEGDDGIDANYLLVEGLFNINDKVDLKVGYEILGSDDHSGFETPLATKHAFNGWADAFIKTPKDGLQDIYVSASAKISGTKLMAVYHDYSSDTGSKNYGSEINLLAVKKYGKNYTALLKYANYTAKEHTGDDTEKLWLMGQMKF